MINRFKEDTDKLMKKAGAMCPLDLVNDPGTEVNADAWERYRTILKGFNVAQDDMSGILGMRYQQAPDNEENFATVTIKLYRPPQKPLFSRERAAFLNFS